MIWGVDYNEGDGEIVDTHPAWNIMSVNIIVISVKMVCLAKFQTILVKKEEMHEIVRM